MHRSEETTVQELEAMVQHLQDYLLGEHLYKTISVHTPSGEHLIKMTLGGMLERIAELEASSPGREVARAAREALGRAQRSLPERFYGMLAREAKSYTDSWNWFLQNCWEADARCTADYSHEVGSRLRVQRLLDFGGEHEALADTRQRVRSLDERLRAIWEPGQGPLLGSAEAYPQAEYWWLYGQPRPQEAP